MSKTNNKPTLTKANAKELRSTNATPVVDDYVEASAPAAEREPAPELTQATEPMTMEDVPALSKQALALLDRAIQTTIKNRGQNLNDEAAKLRLSSQADLLEATQGNLAIAAMAIMESPTPEDLTSTDRRPNRVFSLLYGVMRSLIFNANGAYRRWLDPRPNFAVADARDATQAPWGLQPEAEDEDFEATIRDAVEEIAAYFAALAQVCGFNLVPDGDAGLKGGFDAGFPLAYEVRPDQTLAPVTDFFRAVDIVEAKRQANLKRRAETEQKAYGEARTRALELLAKLQMPKTVLKA